VIINYITFYIKSEDIILNSFFMKIKLKVDFMDL